MAAARKTSTDVEESTSDLEGEGAEATSLSEDLEETSLDEAFAEEEDDDLGGEPGLDDEEPSELTGDPLDVEGEQAATDEQVAQPADASFDDEDDEGIVAAVAGEDDDHEIEGLRDGEFVCRACFMAKRDTQLADPERLFCRDCA